MISRAEYIKALDIVEQYHKQLAEILTIQKTKNWEDLTIGDMIIFDNSRSKHILPNKAYQVTYVSSDWKQKHRAYYGIMMENGKQKWLAKFAKGYRARMV